jgi:Zn finger protein HypA/HybF involved in hydrogenase expression
LTEDPAFACSFCGATGIELVSGSELQITEIEVDDLNGEA